MRMKHLLITSSGILKTSKMYRMSVLKKPLTEFSLVLGETPDGTMRHNAEG
jgi:hypothetical protein